MIACIYCTFFCKYIKIQLFIIANFSISHEFLALTEMARPSSSVETVSHYSRLTGWIYIFNLIVGTGALTLPAAFHDAGWLLSTIIIILLACMSYLTTTYVIGKNDFILMYYIHTRSIRL